MPMVWLKARAAFTFQGRPLAIDDVFGATPIEAVQLRARRLVEFARAPHSALRISHPAPPIAPPAPPVPIEPPVRRPRGRPRKAVEPMQPMAAHIPESAEEPIESPGLAKPVDVTVDFIPPSDDAA